MNFVASTVSLTVDDVAASQEFLVDHLDFSVQASAEGFSSLTRADALDIVLLARGTEVLPPGFRDQHAGGLILAFTVTEGIADYEKRARCRSRDHAATARGALG